MTHSLRSVDQVVLWNTRPCIEINLIYKQHKVTMKLELHRKASSGKHVFMLRKSSAARKLNSFLPNWWHARRLHDKTFDRNSFSVILQAYHELSISKIGQKESVVYAKVAIEFGYLQQISQYQYLFNTQVHCLVNPFMMILWVIYE